MERPRVKLVGEDGNAFAIIGRCRRAAEAAGMPDEEWHKIRDEMTSGDYNHLLAVVLEHFDEDSEDEGEEDRYDDMEEEDDD